MRHVVHISAPRVVAELRVPFGSRLFPFSNASHFLLVVLGMLILLVIVYFASTWINATDETSKWISYLSAIGCVIGVYSGAINYCKAELLIFCSNQECSMDAIFDRVSALFLIANFRRCNENAIPFGVAFDWNYSSLERLLRLTDWKATIVRTSPTTVTVAAPLSTLREIKKIIERDFNR